MGRPPPIFRVGPLDRTACLAWAWRGVEGPTKGLEHWRARLHHPVAGVRQTYLCPAAHCRPSLTRETNKAWTGLYRRRRDTRQRLAFFREPSSQDRNPRGVVEIEPSIVARFLERPISPYTHVLPNATIIPLRMTHCSSPAQSPVPTPTSGPARARPGKLGLASQSAGG